MKASEKLSAFEDMVEALKVAPPIGCDLTPVLAFELVATIQLSCIHPGLQGTTRKSVEAFARVIAMRLPTEAQEYLKFGWDMNIAPDEPASKIGDRWGPYRLDDDGWWRLVPHDHE